MAKQWVRQETKRNEIAVFIQTCLSFYKKNRESIIVGTGIGIVLIAVVVYFVVQYMSLNIRAWGELSRAQGMARSGNISQAEINLKEIAQNFKRTPASIHSLLFLAEIYSRDKNYKKASDIYQQIIDSYRNNTLLPFAYIGLGSSLLNMGNLDKAVDIYQIFSDKHPDHFLYPAILQSLGYCYEKTNQIDDARTQYEKIVTLYPQTIWAENAYAWLNLLQKKESTKTTGDKS